MEPIEFTARDGLKLEGYCTFPVGDVDGTCRLFFCAWRAVVA